MASVLMSLVRKHLLIQHRPHLVVQLQVGHHFVPFWVLVWNWASVLHRAMTAWQNKANKVSYQEASCSVKDGIVFEESNLAIYTHSWFLGVVLLPLANSF